MSTIQTKAKTGKTAAKRNRKHFPALISSLFKIGFLGFGGGCALIPVMEKEIVEDAKLVTQKEYDKDTLVACITPGALPIEIATGLGLSAYGITGMLSAALALALPGSLLTVLILALLSGADGLVLTEIQCFSIGVGAFISYLLLLYAINTLRESRNAASGNTRKTFLVMFAVFFLGCGKTFSNLPFMNGKYLFGLSTIQILGLAFFVILFTGGKNTPWKTAVSAVLVVLYALSAGHAHLIPGAVPRRVLVAAMYFCAAAGMILSIRDDLRAHRALLSGRNNFLHFLKEIIAWLLLLAVCALPALLLTEKTPLYLIRGFFSSIISFGGGDAYLSVADGLFVNSGMVTYGEFYSLLVPVANVLPGSILSKILTGVGYYIGYNLNGSPVQGIVVAFAGFICSVVASGLVFCLVYHAYNSVEHITVFQKIGHWIRPIIAGLLLSVMCSMIQTSLNTAASIGIAVLPVFLVTCGIIVLNLSLMKKKSNPFMIAASSLIGLVASNLLLFFA